MHADLSVDAVKARTNPLQSPARQSCTVSFGTAMATQSRAAEVDMAWAGYSWSHSFDTKPPTEVPHLNRYKDLLLDSVAAQGPLCRPPVYTT